MKLNKMKSNKMKLNKMKFNKLKLKNMKLNKLKLNKLKLNHYFSSIENYSYYFPIMGKYKFSSHAKNNFRTLNFNLN